MRIKVRLRAYGWNDDEQSECYRRSHSYYWVGTGTNRMPLISFHGFYRLIIMSVGSGSDGNLIEHSFGFNRRAYIDNVWMRRPMAGVQSEWCIIIRTLMFLGQAVIGLNIIRLLRKAGWPNQCTRQENRNLFSPYIPVCKVFIRRVGLPLFALTTHYTYFGHNSLHI